MSAAPPGRSPRRGLLVGGGLLAIAAAAAVGIVALAIGGGGRSGGGPVTPTAALAAPRMLDETVAAGLDHTFDGGADFAVGGGVSVFDCNADGLPDLFLAGGSNPAGLFRNASPAGGALRFVRVGDPATAVADVNGAYPLDIDGDGVVDLALLQVGGAHLLRGLGDCRFENADARWSFDAGGGWRTAFSASWETATASLPTLALGSYVGLDADAKPTWDCVANALYRPAAGATTYAPPTPLAPGFCSLSMLFLDWDGSGRRDLRVSNDRQYYTNGEEQLWRIAPGEAPRLYTADDGWAALQVWGMGIASRDLTGDGLPEVYLTSQGDNKLQTLAAGPSQPRYRDIALKRGVTAAQPFTGGDALPSTTWHPEFVDANNDGFADLFLSKGNVSAMPDYAARDPSELLLGQPDGTFVQGADAAGIVAFERGRGAALADLNSDGLPDLVEVFYGAPARVWRNVGGGTAATPAPMGGWLGIRLRQAGPNRDAIGARLEVQAGDLVQRFEVTVGGGHIGGQLGPLHVGLGPSGSARARVTWPEGEVGPWLDAAANQVVLVERGATAAVPWQPGR